MGLLERTQTSAHCNNKTDVKATAMMRPTGLRDHLTMSCAVACSSSSSSSSSWYLSDSVSPVAWPSRSLDRAALRTQRLQLHHLETCSLERCGQPKLRTAIEVSDARVVSLYLYCRSQHSCAMTLDLQGQNTVSSPFLHRRQQQIPGKKFNKFTTITH